MSACIYTICGMNTGMFSDHGSTPFDREQQCMSILVEPEDRKTDHPRMQVSNHSFNGSMQLTVLIQCAASAVDCEM
jgi:hypothetical protein